MSKTMIINLENANGVERDMTAEEQTLHDEIVSNEQARMTAKTEAENKKATDAKAGNDKLIELGLTQDQVTAMTGYVPPSE